MTTTHRILAAALAVGALASGASAARAAAPPPTGDPAGIELARKVNAYYAGPARMGLELRTTLAGVVVTTRLVLARGKIRAIIATAGSGRNRATMAATSGGEYLREPGERCWTRVGRGSGGPDQSMIAMRGSRFLAPESIGALTRLESATPPAARGRVSPTRSIPRPAASRRWSATGWP